MPRTDLAAPRQSPYSYWDRSSGLSDLNSVRTPGFPMFSGGSVRRDCPRPPARWARPPGSIGALADHLEGEPRLVPDVVRRLTRVGVIRHLKHLVVGREHADADVASWRNVGVVRVEGDQPPAARHRRRELHPALASSTHRGHVSALEQGRGVVVGIDLRPPGLQSRAHVVGADRAVADVDPADGVSWKAPTRSRRLPRGRSASRSTRGRAPHSPGR